LARRPRRRSRSLDWCGLPEAGWGKATATG
jgi:hypothetical protein